MSPSGTIARPDIAPAPAHGGTSAAVARLRVVLRAWLIGIACLATLDAGYAIDFKCIEPSRYKNLLTAFNDDPSVLTSYFGLDGGQLPDLNACRALALTGTIRPGDAEALLNQVIQAKGGLAVLYLSFDGIQIAEEIKLAQIVRGFWLETRIADASSVGYSPDFATPWGARAAVKDFFSATAPPLNPMKKGLDSFGRRGDLGLPLRGDRNTCLESCLGVWGAGVHRQVLPAPPIAPKQRMVAVPEMATARPRAALVASLDGGKVPPPGDSRWTAYVGPGTLPVMPAPVERNLREKCTAELVAGEASVERFGDAMNSLADDHFGGLKDDPLSLLSQLDGLRAAGMRLQKCVAGAFERQRLASFRQYCGNSCDKGALMKSFERNAQALIDNLSLENIVGPQPFNDPAQQIQETELDWQGMWTRRGTSNVFDATWSNPKGQHEMAMLEIALGGDGVTIIRTGASGRCLYQGKLADRALRGTYICFGAFGAFAWQATLH